MATPIIPEEQPPARINGKTNPAYMLWWRAQRKEHVAAYQRAYVAGHLDAKHARDKQYREKNRDKMVAYLRAYYAEHREELNEKSKQYHRGHAEAVKARRHEYYLANCEHIKARVRAYNAANPEKRRLRAQRYRATHPENMRALKRRKQARRRGAPIHDLTAAQWREIKAAYGYRCVYCKRKMQRLSQDHITPLSKGGSHTRSNVVPACVSCNSKKYNGAVLCPVQPLLLTIA